MISRGTWYVALAYTLWGFFPIYWKALAGLPALQLICHRIVWSVVVLAMLVARSQDWRVLWQAARSPRVLGIYTAAGVAIALNWLMFVWAVSINQIVQISLGYFINPLLSVVLGLLVFHERLRTLQWVSIALAAAGVLYLTVAQGAVRLDRAVPRRVVRDLWRDEEDGAPGTCSRAGAGNRHPVRTGGGVSDLGGARRARRPSALRSCRDVMMVGAGPITTIPLLLFAAGVRQIPLTLVGMLQYINPTMQISIAHSPLQGAVYRASTARFRAGLGALVLLAVEGYATSRWPQMGVTDVAPTGYTPHVRVISSNAATRH